MTDDISPGPLEAGDFLRLIHNDVKGFIYLDDLSGNPRSFYIPMKADEAIEDASWALADALYYTPMSYTDGRIERKDGKIETGRRKANAKEGSAVFCDADLAAPDKWAVEPSIVVETSPGRFHLYWLLDRAHTAVEIALIAKKMSWAMNDVGADISSSSLTKLLLVPGSHNTKTDLGTGELVHPERPEIVATYTGKRYTMEDLERVYGDTPVSRIIETEGIDDEMPADIPEWKDVYNGLGEVSKTGANWDTLIFDEGWLDQLDNRIGDRSKWRYRLLCDLFREDLSMAEVLSVAWAAKSSTKWEDDPRGMRGLWSEAVKAQVEVAMERGDDIAHLDDAKEYQVSSAGTMLLTPEEREAIESDKNFISDYVAWTKSRLTRANLPYARINAWQALALALGGVTYINEEHGPAPINFFTLTLGETGSGKGQAKSLWHEVLDSILDEGFRTGNSVNLGANAHPNALLAKLNERDGLVSLVQSDEADGVFRQMKDSTWTAGTMELWTDLYDGWVPKMLRRGEPELADKSARTVFNIWLAGTVAKLRKVLDSEMFESGFIGRFMFAIGDAPDRDPDAMIPRRGKGSKAGDIDPVVGKWGDEFAILRDHYEGRRGAFVYETDEALVRIGRAVQIVTKFAEGHRHASMLDMAIRRAALTMRKAATLLALHEMSETVTLRHALLAVQAYEEWFEALVYITGHIASSDWSRLVNEIDTAIQRAPGGFLSKSALHRRFDFVQPMDRDRALTDLANQGRVKRDSVNGKPGYRAVE